MPHNTKVMVYRWAPGISLPGGFESVLPGWDPDCCGPDEYASRRARRLYRALGSRPDDEELVLGELADGRWALVGLLVEGHAFAVEGRLDQLTD